MDDGKLDKIIDNIQSAFTKEFGTNSMGRLSDDDSLSKISGYIETGSSVVDYVLRGGRPKTEHNVGIPLGRQMSIEGLEGSSKTTLCAQICANLQKQGGIFVMVDAEDRVDEPYWQSLGCDTSRILSIPETKIEDIFRKQVKMVDYLKKLAPDRACVFAWDSIGSSSVVRDDKDDCMSDASYGKEAKVLARGLKLINHEIAKSKIAYIYTNHLYQKMGVTFGDSYESSGGQKLKYFATVRLRLTKIGQISEEDEHGQKVVIGNKVLVKAIKNSMSPNLLECSAAVIGGVGYSNEWSVRERAENLKFITKAGAWSTVKFLNGEEVKFQGFSQFLEKVVPHPQYKELAKKVWE